MRQLGIKAGQGVLERVLRGQAAQGQAKAGLCAGPGHIGTRLQFLSLPHGPRQGAGDPADGIQRKYIAGGVGGPAQIALYRMEQHVKPLIGGKRRGHAAHQLRIHDAANGEAPRRATGDLFVPLGIRDHAARVHLRAGAGRGGDRDQGKRPKLRLHPSAGPIPHIIPQVAVVHGHQGDGLGGVDGAAAAQCYQEITAGPLGQGGAVHHLLPGGIGAHPIVQGIGGAGGGQLLLQAIQISQTFCGFSRCGYYQRAAPGQFDPMQLRQRTRPEYDPGGQIILKIHDGSSFFVK